MIVSCPSCGTRYNHHPASVGESATARCSCCDDMVPLVVAGRPYMILPVASAERPVMTIGMDDPRLAEQLVKTALDAASDGSAAAISYGVKAGEAAQPQQDGGWARRISGANGSAPAIFDKRRRWLGSSKARRASKMAEKASGRGAATEAPSGRRALELSVAGVLTTVGGLTAYFSAVEQGLNPLTWSVAGGGLGLFMAWICLKWTRQH